MGRLDLIKFMVNEKFPRLATRDRWPVTENHCFLRIAYDNLFGRPWKEVLDPKKPAIYQLTLDQVEEIITILKRFPDEIEELNIRSLELRKTSRTDGRLTFRALPTGNCGGSQSSFES